MWRQTAQRAAPPALAQTQRRAPRRRCSPAAAAVGVSSRAAARVAHHAAAGGGLGGGAAWLGGSGARGAARERSAACTAAATRDAQPAEVAELQGRWGVPHAVLVEEGVAGMTRVVLTHGNGSCANVYLHGANVTSWRISNGSDVLYLRPDTPLDGVKPISGGIPICWPQFGPGGDTPGGIPGQAPMQQHGFARSSAWDIVATGLTADKREPWVRLRLRDSPATRAMWDHAFELDYEVQLGARDLALTLTARNTGAAPFAFTAALHSYLGVQDVREPNVMLLGLQGTSFIDKFDSNPPAVMPVEEAPVHRIRGPTDKIFVASPARVALEVGTGCTVFVENTAGFTDHVVWNPWRSNMHYPNFVCVENAVVAAPVSVEQGAEWVGKSSLFVRDIVLSAGMKPADDVDA